MKIAREVWTKVCEDYFTGKGSLAELARRHGLKVGSVEKACRRGSWVKLRSDYEAARMAKLIPPLLPTLPALPVAPDGTISESWLRVQQEIHYRKGAELLDKMRALLEEKLAASEKPSSDELGKLTSAMSGLVSAGIALLGLNRPKDKDKNRRPRKPYAYPEPAYAPQPVVPQQTP